MGGYRQLCAGTANGTIDMCRPGRDAERLATRRWFTKFCKRHSLSAFDRIKTLNYLVAVNCATGVIFGKPAENSILITKAITLHLPRTLRIGRLVAFFFGAVNGLAYGCLRRQRSIVDCSGLRAGGGIRFAGDRGQQQLAPDPGMCRHLCR